MEWLYIVIALVVVGLVAFWVLRGRGAGAPPPTPTVAPPAPAGLRDRLGKTRRALADRLGGVFNRSGFDTGFWSDIEDSLVAADVGVGAASRAVESVRSMNPESPGAVRHLLVGELVSQLADADRHLEMSGDPSVVLVVGVNGSGKTTTIAKLAQQLTTAARPVLLGA
ncbi:MAG: hypothetical protein QNJ77_13600, partial [Acidimicrobiia bacterium]|nr:hypothetical protein [Acidimicrobiia bacterium]